MPNKKSTRKTLSFSVTGKEYADFWYVAEILGETKKKLAFIKMLKYIKNHKGL